MATIKKKKPGEKERKNPPILNATRKNPVTGARSRGPAPSMPVQTRSKKK